jgi:hypothetical protein
MYLVLRRIAYYVVNQKTNDHRQFHDGCRMVRTRLTLPRCDVVEQSCTFIYAPGATPDGDLHR